MAHEKQYKLAEKILADDGAYKIKWTIDFLGNLEFSGKKFNIYLGIDSSGNTIDYYVRVTDQEGQTVDRFTDTELDAEKGRFMPFELDSYFNRFSYYYAGAHRKAAGADEAIDDIIEDL